MRLSWRAGTRDSTSFSVFSDYDVDQVLCFLGIEAQGDVAVTEADWEGPLPSVLTKGIDWLLLFSVLFLAGFVMYATVRTESIRWLIPGQEHEHQE